MKSNESFNAQHLKILGEDEKYVPLTQPKHSIKIDHRRILEVPGNHHDTLKYAIEHFIAVAQHAIESKGKFFVALSGGSTPREIYSHLASEKYRHFINWKKVFLFWSDERSVSPEDADSNYKMAMDSGLKKLGIPANQIHRMEAESDIEQNATMYQQLIESTLGSHSFDLVMLGMGDDGHTASIFPGTEAIDEKNKWVVANYVPAKNTWRMTMTLPFINQAENVVVYVFGDKKKDMLHKILYGEKTPEPLPAEKIGSSSHPARWIADEKAAEKALKHS